MQCECDNRSVTLKLTTSHVGIIQLRSEVVKSWTQFGGSNFLSVVHARWMTLAQNRRQIICVTSWDNNVPRCLHYVGMFMRIAMFENVCLVARLISFMKDRIFLRWVWRSILTSESRCVNLAAHQTSRDWPCVVDLNLDSSPCRVSVCHVRRPPTTLLPPAMTFINYSWNNIRSRAL